MKMNKIIKCDMTRNEKIMWMIEEQRQQYFKLKYTEKH